MHNRFILEEMKRIYGHTRIDWMGYKVTKHNKLTYHHINEKRNGGEESVENGALLTRTAHDILHKLEIICPELYEEYNCIFKIINLSKRPPSPAIKELIEEKNILADRIIFEYYKSESKIERAKRLIKR